MHIVRVTTSGHSSIEQSIPSLMMKTEERSNLTQETTHPPSNITPTEMIRKFREQVRRGEITMPFDEGVTREQRELHESILKSRLP